MLLSRPERDEILIEGRATTMRVARTFSLACRLLPRAIRGEVYRLYLVFRTLDDLVDDRDPRAAGALAAVERWCLGGAPEGRQAAILADIDSRQPLPRGALLDFCRGMRDDLTGRPIGTEAELDCYCYRVAGTVGVVMAAVLGVRGPAALPHAAALGMAMQRTNLLRDIDEDLASGRVYLAEETVARLGGPEPGAREALLRDGIARADALYEQGIAGIPMLLSGRAAIRAAGAMYREILRQIERDGYGARAGRATVPTARKLLVAARASV